MISSSTLLTSLVVAAVVAASPVVQIRNSPINVPISRRVNFTGSATLLEQDRRRAARMYGKQTGAELADDAVGSAPVDNQAVTYIASVGVGSPATTYDLIVDTGSSNTWVGANTAYTMTSTSEATGQLVSVTYGSGSFSGEEYTDTVTLGDGLTVTAQSIGVATTSEGFSGTDGILGLGPVDLTEGTLTLDPNAEIPTFTDNLYSQGVIPEDLVGISFEPTTSENDENGELTFGGTDSSRYTGAITYTPITSTESASYYWGIDQSISYGSTTILSETAGIVDTGTTLILIATDALNEYVSMTGATSDENTGLYSLTSAQYANLDSLYFNVGGTSFELTPNAQIWPRSLNTDIGGSADGIYLIVGDIGSNSGSGLDFINGYAFLERFYSVFDTGNRQVGLATTSYTYATSN